MAITQRIQALDPKACESALRAAQFAASSVQTGPAVFWQGHMALLAGTRCAKGDTYSQPAYFSVDNDEVRRVTFRAAEDDADW
ncbi:hypothetical protein EB72_06475 [Mycobacterium sp. SWH-M1]|nr:hypothetical protein EB72_06475 [Mycobacterium sp. SWH-M1]